MATLTIKEIAQKWDATPRTVRKFMRSDAKAQGGTIGEDTPGKGGRYAVEAKAIRSLEKRFNAWKAANEAKAAARAESDEGDDALDAGDPDMKGIDEEEMLDPTLGDPNAE